MTKFASGFRTARTIKGSVKYSGIGLKKKNISVATLLIICLLTSLLLAACGERPLPSSVNTNNTPDIVTVIGSPAPTFNQASLTQAIPTATAF